MDQREWQRRLEITRDYMATAAGGIAIGASLFVLIPVRITQDLGLGNTRPVGVKVALFAATVWSVFRIVRLLRR